MLTRLIAKLQGLRRDGLIVTLGWYGLAELATRVARLATTIVLARWLLAVDFGIAAAVLTAFELIRVIGANGVALLIVSAREDDLARTTATAWRVCVAATAVMIALTLAAGLWLAPALGEPRAVYMMAALAASLLVQPFADVAYGLLMRADRARTIGLVTAAHMGLEAALTIVLAVAGAGAFAIIAAKVLSAPLNGWLLVRHAGWRPRQREGAMLLEWRGVAAFSLPLLGAELLAALRTNADKILIGAYLGVETLGVYSFAFNAGIGLSLSFTAALSTTLYPHFASLAHRPAELDARYAAALRTTVLPMAALILLQAATALVYVPIVFGAKWQEQATLVGLLCLSGVTRPLYDAARQLLRAKGQTAEEFRGSLAFTAVVLAGFAAALPYGLRAAAATLAVVSIAGHLAFAMFARARAAPHPMTEQPA